MSRVPTTRRRSLVAVALAIAAASLALPALVAAAPHRAALAVKVGAKPATITGSATARITWTLSKKGTATFTCRLDGAAAKRCTSPYTATGLRTGAHSLKISGTLAGATASTTVRWTVDRVAPTLVVSGGSTTWANTASVTITAVASDASAGVATVEHRTSTDAGATWGAAAAGASATISDEGQTQVEFRATDRVGNASAWTVAGASATAAIDRTAPVAPDVTGVPGSWFAGPVTATAASTDDGLVRIEHRSSSDGTTWSDPATGATFTQSVDGSIDVEFRAVDHAGNLSDWTLPATIQVDATAPDVPTVTGVPVGWSQTAVTAVGASSDATSGLLRIEHRTSTNGGASYGAAATGTDVTQSADGVLRVEYRAWDNAGNVSAWSGPAVLQVDGTAPTVPTVDALAGWQSAAVTATASSTDAGSGLASVDPIVYQTSSNGTDWSPAAGGHSFTQSTDGSVFVQFAAVDAAGNTSEYSTPVQLQVDLTAPAAPSIVAPTGWHTTGPLTATATAVDLTSGVASVVYETSATNSGSDWSAETAGTAVTLSTDGAVYARFRTTDNAGNVSAWSTTAHLQLDTTVPNTPSVSALSGWQTSATSATATATDATSGIASYEHQTSATTTFGSTWTAGGTVTQSADGATYVRFRAIDNAGLVSAPSAASHLQVDATAPSVPTTSGGTAPGTWSTVAPTTVTASASTDATSGLARYEHRTSSDNGATWSTPAAGASAGISIDGQWLIQDRAVDNAGNASGWTSSVTVWLDATAPAAPSIANASATWFNAASRTLTASTTDATSGIAGYSYETSVDGGSTWSSTTALDHVTVSAQGETQVRFRATDVAGNTSSSTIGLVRIDRGVPADPTLSGIPVGWSTALHATVTASSAAPLSGIDHYIYQTSTDNTHWTTSQTGDTIEVSGEGSTYVRFFAFSGTGTPSGPTTGTVQLDRTGPSAPTLAGALSGWRSTASETVTASGSTDAGSGGVTYSWLTSTDNGTTWSTPTAGSSALVTAQGTTLVDFYAIDAVGNISSVSEATVMIDRTAPSVPTIADLPVGWSTASVTVHAHATDSAAGVGSYEYETSSDGTTWSGPTTAGQATLTSEGDTYVRFRAIDAVGNTSAFSAGDLVQIDTVAPVTPTTFAGTAAGWQTSGPVTLAPGGSSDATSGLAGYQYRIGPAGGTLGAATAAPADVTVDGDYDVQFRAIDNAGLTSGWTATKHVRLDTVAPTDPTLSGGTDGWSSVATATITPTSSDSTSGVTSYDWQTSPDNATWSPAGTSATLDITDEGTTYVQAMATDAAGLTSGWSTSAIVQLDRVSPTTPTVSGGGSSWNTAAFDLTASATDATSSVVSYEYQTTTHGGSFSGTPATSADGTIHVTVDGDADYRVRAVDSAGNASAWSTTTEAMLDATAPATPTLANPDAGVWTNTASETVTPTSSDATSGLTGSFAWETSTDGTTWTPAASGATFDETNEGLEYVHAAAIDAAGNQSDWSAPSAIQIDRGDPTLPTVSGGNGPAWSSAATISVTGSLSTDALSPVHYEHRSQIDGGGFGSAATGATLAVTAEGSTDVEFRAVDAAGNQSAWTSIADAGTVQLDRTAPTAPNVSGGGSSWTNSSPISLSASGSTDTPSGVNHYQYDVMPAGGSFAGPATGSSVSVTTNGDRVYRFRAVDEAGNTSPWSTLVQARLDVTAPPTPTQTGAVAGWQSQASETITPSSVDALSGTASYDWRTSTDGGSTWSGQGSGATLTVTAETTTLVQSRAHDAAGNASGWSTSATVMLDRTAPTGTSVSGGAAGWQNVASVTVSASGASDALSGFAGYEHRVSTDGGSSWSPGVAGASVTVSAEGETLVQFRALDAIGNATSFGPSAGTAAATVRIERTLPSAPTVSGGSLSWTNQPVIFSAAGTSTAASGIAGYEYRTSLNGGLWSAPAAAAGGTATISGDGTTTVQFRAVSNAGQSSSWRPTVAGAASTAMIDTVLPTAPGATGGSTSWQVGPVLIQATGGSDALSGVTSTLYETSADNSTWSAATAGTSFSVTAGGTTYVRFARVDAAGNVGPYSTVGAGSTARIDVSAPTVPTIAADGTTDAWTTAASITLTPSSTDDSGVTPTYEYQLSTNGGSTWSSATAAPDVTVSDEGTTWVRFRALDAAGHQSAYSTSVAVMLDRVAPTGMVVTGGSSTWADVPSVTVSAADATDAGSGVDSYQYSTDGGSTWTPGSSVTIDTEGETTVSFTVTDAVGNTSAATDSLVRIDHSAPSIPTVSGGLGLGTCDVSATITASGSVDAGSGLDHYESRISTDGGLTYGPTISVGDTVTLSVTGSYTVQFRAVDVLGFASAWGPATNADANQACIS